MRCNGTLEIRSELYDDDHPKVAQSQCIYARVLASRGEVDEARMLLQQGLPIYESWPMANKKRIRQARSLLADLE